MGTIPTNKTEKQFEENVRPYIKELVTVQFYTKSQPAELSGIHPLLRRPKHILSIPLPGKGRPYATRVLINKT